MARRANPYGEDNSVTLPDGCIAEDVDMDFSFVYSAPNADAAAAAAPAQASSARGSEPRPLTFGFENGPLATLSSSKLQQGNGAAAAAEPARSPANASPSEPLNPSEAPAGKQSGGASAYCGWLPCVSSIGPDIEERFGRKFTLGERLADRVSSAVGSWYFVCSQTCVLVFWLLFNAISDNGPDPYPFILLNLLLSFQAAYTGPIVMMSQNRQSDIDRDKAFDLHEKVDHIRLNQVWALWDQMQLQQKKLDTMQEGMERMLQWAMEQQAAAQQAQPAAGSASPSQPLDGGAAATFAQESSLAAVAAAHAAAHAPDAPGLAHAHLFPVSPALAESGPCDCLPPNMCSNCMSALERAEVTPAFLRKANPTWIASAPSSFPTAEFVRRDDSVYSRPLEYKPTKRLSPMPSRREMARGSVTAPGGGGAGQRSQAGSPERAPSSGGAQASQRATSLERPVPQRAHAHTLSANPVPQAALQASLAAGTLVRTHSAPDSGLRSATPDSQQRPAEALAPPPQAQVQAQAQSAAASGSSSGDAATNAESSAQQALGTDARPDAS